MTNYEKIEQLRKLAKLTKGEMATVLNVTNSCYSKWAHRPVPPTRLILAVLEVEKRINNETEATMAAFERIAADV